MEQLFSPVPDAPVLIIGAAGIDIVGRLHTDLELGTSNPARIRSSYGGVARNVAENLARLGQPVWLITAVGEDPIGEQLLRHTQDAGVNIDYSLRTPDAPTGTYLAVVGSSGKLQTALDDMRSVAAVTPELLDKNAGLFERAALLFIDANLPRATLARAVSLARKTKLPIAADPTSTLLAKKLRPHLHKLDLITPNLAEVEVLCDQTDRSITMTDAIERAKCLVAAGVGIVIVTMGEYGVCYASAKTSGNLPAIQTEVVDPTGGGDALTAAVLFGLLNGIPLDDSLRLGVSAATLTLRYPGAVVPDLSLEKLYDQLVI